MLQSLLVRRAILAVLIGGFVAQVVMFLFVLAAPDVSAATARVTAYSAGILAGVGFASRVRGADVTPIAIPSRPAWQVLMPIAIFIVAACISASILL